MVGVLFDRKRIKVREIKELETGHGGYTRSLYTDGESYYITESDGSNSVEFFGKYETEEQAIKEFCEYVPIIGSSTLYYLRTNGYDMMALVANENEESYYITATLGNEELFPSIDGEKDAEKHLESFAEDNDFTAVLSWESDLTKDQILDGVEILATKRVYW